MKQVFTSMEVSAFNRRIAKNTLFLYIRMLLVMLVTLYTSRVVLKALGIDDFGVFNVVGGIVAIMGLLQSVMSSSVSRFFSFELGRKNYMRLNQLFRLSIIVYAGIAVIVLILAETIGIWFLKNMLIIPPERMVAAFWVYQFSIFSFIARMMAVPYNSVIIARERMNFYAFIGIVEVLLKLMIVYLLLVFPLDKLKLYAILDFIVILAVSISYFLYGSSRYLECRFSWFWDRSMVTEMVGYSIWSLYGALANVARNHGVNILLGMFFNPAVNAARAVAYQVNSAINQFSNNFYTAVRPQITKQFAAGQNYGMMKLVFRSSRFTFYLVFVFALPFLLETQNVLNLWLNNPPDNSVLFTRLVIVTSLIDSLSHPFMTAINATGNIKYYQIVTGGVLILTLPVAYLFLRLGHPPESTMYVAIAISVIAQVSRVAFMKIQQKMSVTNYLRNVILYVVAVFVFSSILPYIAYRFVNYGHVRFLLVFAASIFSCMFFIYSIGITVKERKYINMLIAKIIRNR